MHYRVCVVVAICLGLLMPARAQVQTPEFLAQWGLAAIHADKALAAGYTGAGIGVSITDVDFVEFNHPEFAGRAHPVQAIDNLYDHSTKVAGVIGAARDGVGMHGVAPGVLLSSIQVFGTADLNRSIAAGIRIFNNSWAIIGFPNPQNLTPADLPRIFNADYLNAFRNAAAAGAVFVFATGNEGNDYPNVAAALPYIAPELRANWIAVTAVDPTMAKAGFANACGVAAAWCMAAPGVDIYTTYAFSLSYTSVGGTSFAAPHVTGALAIAREMFPKATGEQLAAFVLHTATDIGAPGLDPVFGWGFLNMGNMVDSLEPRTGALFANSAFARFATMDMLFGTIGSRMADWRAPGGSSEIMSYAPAGARTFDAFAGFDAGAERDGSDRNVWGRGVFGHASIASGATSPAAHINIGGGVGGADMLRTDEWRVGYAAGMTTSSLSMSGVSDRSWTTALHGFGYASWQRNGWFVDATLGGTLFQDQYNRHDIAGTSGTVLARQGLTGIASGDGYGVGARVAAGRGFFIDHHWVEPYLHTSWFHQRIGAAQEFGADVFSLALSAVSLEQFEGGAGMRVQFAPYRLDTVFISTIADIAYGRRASAGAIPVTVELMGTPILAQTAELGRDVLRFATQVKVARPDSNVAGYLAYNGLVQDGASIHNVSGGIQVRF